MKKIIRNILIKRIFKQYRGSLPEKSNLPNPRMEYHALADGVLWEDEGLTECHPDLENAFRFVLHYRTNLITGKTNISNTDKRYFGLARKHFPTWIGFESSRCSYNAELSDRIERLRKVSIWRIDKLLKYDSDNIE